MKFKGNFGELTLIINGTEATGTYQENGTLEGQFVNNTFKGQWKNKGIEGLAEFTIIDNKLEGNWKKGKESGAMRGKWWGERVGADTQEKVAEEQEEASHLPDGWGTASAIAALIRHMMVADKKVSDAKIMLMHQAIEYYDNLDIPLGEVWDNIDDEMQIYEKIGLQGQILEKCAAHLAKTFDEDEMQHFWNILINVTVQDRDLHYYEYVALKYTTGILMPNVDFNDITAQMRKNGITVDDGSDSTSHIEKLQEEKLNKWSIIHDIFTFYTFFANLAEDGAQDVENEYCASEIKKWQFEIDDIKYGLAHGNPESFMSLADDVFDALYVEGDSVTKDPFIQLNESHSNLSGYFNQGVLKCGIISTLWTSMIKLCQLRGITEWQDQQLRWSIEQWSSVCSDLAKHIAILNLGEVKKIMAEAVGLEFDEKYHEAREIILSEGAALPEILCDVLLIGKNRAERIFEQLERDGIVTPKDEYGKRKLIK